MASFSEPSIVPRSIIILPLTFRKSQNFFKYPIIIPLLNFNWQLVKLRLQFDRFAAPRLATELKILEKITRTIMFSVNSPMQFNNLHWPSFPPIVGKCWFQYDKWIIIVLLLSLYEALIISMGYHYTRLASLNKSDHNPTPNSHFFQLKNQWGYTRLISFLVIQPFFANYDW